MAPRWPQVNNGPEHINEHATYLREACHQLQAVDKGRANQIPWTVVQSYLASTVALIGKVLQQPSVGEVLHRIQDAAKDIQTIQRDITNVKDSIALGTTPLNTTNFSGVKATTASWAQVVGQAKGSTMPPPVPIQHGINTSKTPALVTAYKDRVVTVRLKDRSVVQRYRNHPITWTKQQVQTAIQENHNTKSIKVVAAYQLKSGDIQIYASTTAEAGRLKANKGWLKGLGEQTELVLPTYGVIVHGVSTKSINVKEQDAVIKQMLSDNYTVIPRAEISYVGWLTKEATLKRASSIVVEFTDPEMANAIIYAGLAWEGQIHQCQLYDRACRVKQCFRCYHYGHIGTQCNVSQTCGYCAEQHESKHCRRKGEEGFSPRCTVCKDVHTAWSNACPARKKEMGRVEQAKQCRSIYWHVPARDHTTRPGIDNTSTTGTTQETTLPGDPAPAQTISPGIEEAARAAAVQAPRETRLSTNQTTNPPVQTVPATATATTIETTLAETILETQMTIATSSVPAAAVIPVEEEWATPATRQDATPQRQPDLLIDPRLRAVDEPFSPSQLQEDDQPPVSEYPMDTLEGISATRDADTWLDNMFNGDDSEWLPKETDEIPSPVTSAASEPEVAGGKIFKGCKCPEHQQIYDSWPTQDAELTIAKCMTVCIYCGVDFRRPPSLRLHLKAAKHAQNNISVVRETMGRGSSTVPSWKPKPPGATTSDTEAPRIDPGTNRTDAPLVLW